MFAKGFFANGYFSGAYFPPMVSGAVGSPPDYDVRLHVGNAGTVGIRMEQMPRNLRLHAGNAEAITLRD